uniref:Uncharacterized protein n=1 Tax=Arundo donax TaxID=35708 RepID=A0A0A9DDL9_ARUDO
MIIVQREKRGLPVRLQKDPCNIITVRNQHFILLRTWEQIQIGSTITHLAENINAELTLLGCYTNISGHRFKIIKCTPLVLPID